MSTSETNNTNLLQHLEERAVRAHNWTSFSPEKRGAQMISDYGQELADDLKELKDQNVSEESLADYQSRYERFFSSYLGAKSNCFSVMITGGSNFPVKRHEKANRSEHRHYEIFREWRERAKKAIIRKAQPAKTFVSELERYKIDLDKMQRLQIIMKACNAIIKKAKGSDCTALLVAAGLSEKNAIEIQKPDFANRIGFASFNLTNNNANIKRVQQRIKELETKENLREENPITNYTFDGGEMIINYEIDRIQILFSTRPTREELEAWKQKGLSGFNWSPSANAWQRKITANAMWVVKRMFTNIKKAN